MFGSALWSLNQVLAAAIRKRVQAGSLIHADATPAPQGASIIQEKWVAGVCTVVFIIWCLVVHDAYICISVCRQDVLQLYYAPLVLGYLFHVIRFSAVLLNSISIYADQFLWPCTSAEILDLTMYIRPTRLGVNLANISFYATLALQPTTSRLLAPDIYSPG